MDALPRVDCEAACAPVISTVGITIRISNATGTTVASKAGSEAETVNTITIKMTVDVSVRDGDGRGGRGDAGRGC